MSSSRLDEGTVFDPCSWFAAAPVAWASIPSRVYVGCTTNSSLLCSSLYTDESTSGYFCTLPAFSYCGETFIFAISTALVIPYFHTGPFSPGYPSLFQHP